MDNAQDANCIEGRSRFFSVSPANATHQKITVLGKSEKHQLKKLRVLGEDNLSCRARGMGCAGLDGEDELRSSKRYKLPAKCSDDSNTFYHVSVPRKLRSAIKKRSCESISPPLPVTKKLNWVADGLKLLNKDGLMKSNLRMKQCKAEGFAKDSILGVVTKDEEEVAEALYALAGLFPNTAQSNNNKLEVEQSRAKSSASPEADSFVTTFEAPKAEMEPKTIVPCDVGHVHSSNAVGSAAEVVMHSCNDTKQPDISISKHHVHARSDVQEVNFPLPAFISENEITILRPSCESVILRARTESRLELGSKFLKPEKCLESWKYPQNALALTGPACSQLKEQYKIEENRDIGFSSRMSIDNEVRGIPLRSYNAKHPAWFGSSRCIPQSPISRSGNVAKKNTHIATSSKKSWKRCANHVYISRFIKRLQTTERRDYYPIQSTPILTSEGPKEGVHKTDNSLIGTANGFIGITSTDSSSCSAQEKNSSEVRNAILLHKMLVQDQQQASTTSGIYIAQKQSLDFLSLPTGSSGMEASNGTNKARHWPEDLTPLHFPSLKSQYQPANPFPLPQNYYLSASFSGHSTAAAMQQVQLPAYFGNSSYCPPSAGAASSSSLQSDHQQQQPKRAPLLMDHYKSGVASTSRPNWQIGVPEPSPMFHHTQILFPPSRSSNEVIGSKYAPMLRQEQQQGISPSALMPSRTVKAQYHHAPYFHEGNEGGIHSECVPMRIIYNQHI